jgi:hypothetical protein
MEIIISGKFSADVHDAALTAVNELRDLVAATDFSDVPAELNSIVFFPVILSDDLRIATKSHRSHSRKENADFVNVEVDHAKWVGASAKDQFQMVFDALKRGIEETKPKYISATAAAELIARLENARTD